MHAESNAERERERRFFFSTNPAHPARAGKKNMIPPRINRPEKTLENTPLNMTTTRRGWTAAATTCETQPRLSTRDFTITTDDTHERTHDPAHRIWVARDYDVGRERLSYYHPQFLVVVARGSNSTAGVSLLFHSRETKKQARDTHALNRCAQSPRERSNSLSTGAY